MKSINLPYIEELNNCLSTEIIGLLENHGQHGSIESVNWAVQFPYHPITVFMIARSNKSIFINFHVRGNMLKAIYSNDQDPVHEDSCVEFFCQIPGNDYYSNFEFNCIGTCSASRRAGRNEAVKPFSPDEMSSIKRYPSLTRKAFNEMSGQFSWDITVEIPFTLIGLDIENLPPVLMANFYKCADMTENPHFISWNKITTDMPDFHRPEFFGELKF